jgi:hypothetical protein
MSDTVMLWQRLDRPGHESARLLGVGSAWQVAGTAVFAHASQPCRLDYRVLCDAAFRTRTAVVSGWLGLEPIDVEIDLDASGRWRMNGAECPQLEGCVDVDLNFSPATNLLPIRRLHLDVGEAADVRAAWLRFPSFVLEPLDQAYRRTGGTTYRYESAGGCFVTDLEVNATGFVTRYPGFWQAID